jgi:histidine triad (HIT) family protein
MECVFCSIINKKIPAEIVFENESVVVFKDIKPLAPIHLLIVPKKHISSVNEVSFQDRELIGDLFLAAQKAALESGIKDYKLKINVGEKAGQEVFHLHIHLHGGWDNN